MTALPYSYLGPPGTFTEQALDQVPAATYDRRRPVHNTGEALADVVEDRATAAMLAIENTVEGGVTDVLDALSTTPDLRIIGEYLVPVKFAFLTRDPNPTDPITTIIAHPVAYAQCRRWLHTHVPHHTLLPATSNIQAAHLLATSAAGDAVIAPLSAATQFGLTTHTEMISDNPQAMTRFVLVAKKGIFPNPPRTGHDRTSLVVDLPIDQPGTLLKLLEQFATRGVNLSLIHSRPIGDQLGRYRFVVDLDGHINEEHVADALLGVKRFSPRVLFLGSYPRADKHTVTAPATDTDSAYVGARHWLNALQT